MWCIPDLTPLFKERMEDILDLYTKELPEGEEVHNFDETPKQLLSTPHGYRKASLNHVARIDHEYKRQGVRNIFVAVAPFKGTRTVQVTKRRTTEDTANFLWEYCMVTHKDVKHIHLVLDNLNTHKEKGLLRIWGEEKFQEFKKHVTLHPTPFHASWLNMAELEINALKTQGLKRRIATERTMQKVADGIVLERNTRQAKINWGFTKEKAKVKFPALYSKN
jgi:DDE superfamily endonuclease